MGADGSWITELPYTVVFVINKTDALTDCITGHMSAVTYSLSSSDSLDDDMIALETTLRRCFAVSPSVSGGRSLDLPAFFRPPCDLHTISTHPTPLLHQDSMTFPPLTIKYFPGRFCNQATFTFRQNRRCWQQNSIKQTQMQTNGYATWFMAGGAIRITHYEVIDDVITRKL